MTRIIIPLLWIASAFGGSSDPIEIGKLEKSTFSMLNPTSKDLFKNHLIASREGAGTRGGGDGRIQFLYENANLILRAASEMKTVLGSLDYRDIKNEELRTSYLSALEQGFGEEIEKSSIIFLNSCRDTGGERPIVFEDAPNGTICVSESAAVQLEKFSEIDRVGAFIRIRLSQRTNIPLDSASSSDFEKWIVNSGSVKPPESDFALIRSEFNLGFPAQLPTFPDSSMICIEAFPFASGPSPLSEITPLVQSVRKNTSGSYLFRFETGYAKCIISAH